MKNLIVKLLISIILICVIGNVQAQLSRSKMNSKNDTAKYFLSSTTVSTTASMPLIIPPSPVAQEHLKYMGCPVSHATGIPEITIPLYDLKIRQYNLPFTLNYHASGIKVEQAPYPIGYGWSLFPSCRISRTVFGKADEYFLSNTNEILPQNDIHPVNDLVYLSEMALPTTSGSVFDMEKDGQYDIFSVQMPTFSENFILQRTNGQLTAVPLRKTPLKIELRIFDGHCINGFNITDENGVIYQFGTSSLGMYAANEYLELDQARGRAFPVGWMLNKVILPGINNEIVFHYTKPTDLVIYNLAPYAAFTTVYDEGSSPQEYGYEPFGLDFPVTYNFLQKTTSSPKKLPVASCLPLQIIFPTGKIDFSYGYQNRELSQIKISNNNGNEIKKIIFIKNTSGTFLLDKLQNGAETYTFNYNNLRFENGFAQDYWGYYNGKVNNVNLIPSMVLDCPYDKKAIIRQADREPNEVYMQANILNRINYPTGGYVEFKYESNLHNDSKNGNINPIIIGGLRINEMKIYDSSTEKTILKTYKYGINEDGFGNLTIKTDSSSFITSNLMFTTGRPDEHPCVVRSRTISETPHSGYYSSLNPLIWYSQVSEYSSDGKTEFYFNYSPDSQIIEGKSTSEDHQYSLSSRFTGNFYSFISSNPYKEKEKIYKKDENEYVFVKEKKYNYEILEVDPPIRGLIVEPYAKFQRSDDSNSSWKSFILYQPGWRSRLPARLQSDYEYYFSYFDYYIHRGNLCLLSVQEIDSTEQGNMEKNVEYLYDPENLFNLTEERTVSSEGKERKRKYYYPTQSIPEVSEDMCQLLFDNQRLTTPVVVEDYVSNILTSSTKNTYNDYSNRIINLEKVQLKKGGFLFEDRIIYHNYDSHGNPLYITKDNADKVVYLWGYNCQYPIAEIKGATFSDVKSALGYSDSDIESLANQTTPNVTSIGNSLRSHFRNKEVLVTTYTYKPLVGISSVTDPRGVVTTYDYDDFGRLKWIKDMSGNIIESYEYNYQNQ